MKGRDIARPVQQLKGTRCTYETAETIFEGLWMALTVNLDANSNGADETNVLVLASTLQSPE